MDIQIVPYQPGVLLRGAQLSLGVSKLIFFLLSFRKPRKISFDFMCTPSLTPGARHSRKFPIGWYYEASKTLTLKQKTRNYTLLKESKQRLTSHGKAQIFITFAVFQKPLLFLSATRLYTTMLTEVIQFR